MGGLLPLLLLGLLLVSVALPGRRHDAGASVGRSLPDGTPPGIHEIRHIVIIMQENRYFDAYFATYPGANRIPGLAGRPGTVPCIPDPGATTVSAPISIDPPAIRVGHMDTATP